MDDERCGDGAQCSIRPVWRALQQPGGRPPQGRQPGRPLQEESRVQELVGIAAAPERRGRRPWLSTPTPICPRSPPRSSSGTPDTSSCPHVGEAGQRRLKQSRVLVVGAGGLGSPAALYLAAAGVGTIGLVDVDVVDVTNLQRQVLHGTSHPRRAEARVRPRAAPRPQPARHGRAVRRAAHRRERAADLPRASTSWSTAATTSRPATSSTTPPSSPASADVYGAHLPVRGPGLGLRRARRTLLPVPLRRAAAAGRGARAAPRRACSACCRASSAASRRWRPSSCCSASASRSSGGCCSSTRSGCGSASSRCSAIPPVPLCGDSPTVRELIDYEAFCGVVRVGGARRARGDPAPSCSASSSAGAAGGAGGRARDAGMGTGPARGRAAGAARRRLPGLANALDRVRRHRGVLPPRRAVAAGGHVPPLRRVSAACGAWPAASTGGPGRLIGRWCGTEEGQSAEGGTRTPTGLRPLRPERSASTNSTTSARAAKVAERPPTRSSGPLTLPNRTVYLALTTCACPPNRMRPRSAGIRSPAIPRRPTTIHILETWEAGLVLTGTEVKSLRSGKASIKEAYARVPERRGVARGDEHHAVRAGQPLQPRPGPLAQAPAASPRDRAAHRRRRAEGPDAWCRSSSTSGAARRRSPSGWAAARSSTTSAQALKERMMDRETARAIAVGRQR